MVGIVTTNENFKNFLSSLSSTLTFMSKEILFGGKYTYP
jgi:hypothetical protein